MSTSVCFASESCARRASTDVGSCDRRSSTSNIFDGGSCNRRLSTLESKILCEKYEYFLSNFDENTNKTFAIEDDNQEFYEIRECYKNQRYFRVLKLEIQRCINSLHWKMKIKWKNYKQRRTEIIKQFEYGKYEILLRSVFCYDVKKIILSFVFK